MVVPESNLDVKCPRGMALSVKKKMGAIFLLSANLAFTTALSLVPTLAVVVSVLTFFRGFESELDAVKTRLLENLAPGASEALVEKLGPVLSHIHDQSLGLLSGLFLLATSTMLISEVDRSFRNLWGVQPRRTLWFRMLAYWLVLFGIPLVGLCLGLGLHDDLPAGWSDIALMIYVTACLTGIYYFSSRSTVTLSAAATGAVVVLIVLAVSKSIYVWSNAHLFRYNEIYGALAAIPILLIWLRVFWIVVLAGVEVTKLFPYPSRR